MRTPRGLTGDCQRADAAVDLTRVRLGPRDHTEPAVKVHTRQHEVGRIIHPDLYTSQKQQPCRRKRAVLALLFAGQEVQVWAHAKGGGAGETLWGQVTADLSEFVDKRHARQRAERKPCVDLPGTGKRRNNGVSNSAGFF